MAGCVSGCFNADGYNVMTVVSPMLDEYGQIVHVPWTTSMDAHQLQWNAAELRARAAEMERLARDQKAILALQAKMAIKTPVGCKSPSVARSASPAMSTSSASFKCVSLAHESEPTSEPGVEDLQCVAYASPASSEDPVFLVPTSTLVQFHTSSTTQVPEKITVIRPPPGLSLWDNEDSKDAKELASSADGSTTCGSSDDEQDSASEDFTTLVFLNCPNDLSRDDFCKTLDQLGLEALYDFVYLPADMQRQTNLGYCFVNFVSHQSALQAWRAMDGFKDWMVASPKVCCVQWCSSLQGRDGHIALYRNSPVMHEAVAEPLKPILFTNGVRVPFPAPTKKIKAPRMKFGKPKKAC